MDLTLRRTSKSEVGIFGNVLDKDSNIVMVSGEHAYPDGAGGWQPKLAPGVYTCKRGQHQLHSGPIETFEVLGVPNFHFQKVTGLLMCHPGNDCQRDSEGCVLSGTDIDGTLLDESRKAYLKFMALQEGLDTFQLTVI